MKWLRNLLWAAAAKDRRRQRLDEDDRAGMGTAFGLDASIDFDDQTAQADATPSPAAPLPDSTPWVQRLIRRSAL